MEFHNEHIKTAFQIVSSVNVSGDMVDVFWAIRQNLVMADKDFAKLTENTEKEAEANG